MCEINDICLCQKMEDNALAAENNDMYLPPTEVENILFSSSALRRGAHEHSDDQILILQRWWLWAALRDGLFESRQLLWDRNERWVGWRNQHDVHFQYASYLGV